tara:strand:+ start:388 stop:663 length:276 start_codon:yes stop_codon:yes gene_type:complete
MTDWKKKLNLNSYEWWRRHRRVVTFGGLLLLFGVYLNPVIKESRHKEICARFAADLRPDTGLTFHKELGLGNKTSLLLYCRGIYGDTTLYR